MDKREKRIRISNRASSPRSFLERIVPGDPLEVRAVAGRQVRERALLIDPERVSMRAFALLAQEFALGCDARSYERIVEGAVRRAIGEALEAEAELEFRESASSHGVDECSAYMDSLGESLGLAPDDLLSACVRFNDLPHAVREAFVRLILERRDDETTLDVRGSDRLHRYAASACQVLGVDPGSRLAAVSDGRREEPSV